MYEEIVAAEGSVNSKQCILKVRNQKLEEIRQLKGAL